MFEIFKSEYKRYKYWGIGASFTLLALYVFLARLSPFLLPDPAKSFLIPTALFVVAFSFGIIQMALHKRKNQWTYLVHRPLSISKIYLSLTMAGFVLLLVVMVLPWLIMVISLDFFSSAVVDNRHYVYGFYLLITTLFAYLVGQLVVTNASRAIICIAPVAIFFLLATPNSIAALFLPYVSLCLCSVYLNIKSFKPDLNTFVKAPTFVLVTSVVISLGVANILFALASIEAQLPNTFASVSLKPDSISAMKQKNAIEKLRYVLANSTHPKVNDFVAQAQLIEPEREPIVRESYPGTRIGQLHIEDFPISYDVKDEATNSTWQFSHDSRLIEGRDSFTGEPIGAIGVQGFIENALLAADSDRFTDLPIMFKNGLISTRSQYFLVNYKDRVFTPKYQFSDEEFHMSAALSRKDDVLVVTSQQTLIFRKDAFSNTSSWVEPSYRIPNPAPAIRLNNVDTYRIAQGYLLLYYGENYLGFDKPGAEVLLAQTDGEVEILGKHVFTQHNQVLWRRYINFAISPVADYFSWASYSVLDAHPIAPSVMQFYQQRQYPSSVLIFVLITHILSAIIVFLLSRHHKLPASLSIIWLFTSLCFGISGFLSFVFLNSWQITRTTFTRHKNKQPVQQLTATH